MTALPIRRSLTLPRYMAIAAPGPTSIDLAATVIITVNPSSAAANPRSATQSPTPSTKRTAFAEVPGFRPGC